jgi:thioester reductase-like protein
MPMFTRTSPAGLPVTIIRPGVVVGHTRTGAANATDYAASIIAAFARMREYVATDGRFDLSPVDMIARATVLLSLQSPSKDLRVFHLVDAGRVRVREVGQAAAGLEGRGLSFAEFKASMTKRLGSGAVANGAESLRSLGSFLENDAFFTMEQSYRCEATVAALRLLGLDWQCDGSACVRGIVSFLEQSSA